MISVYDNKRDCCGCASCKHICPTKAITMKCDKEGFAYPEIDQEECIDCFKCKNVCAFQNGYEKEGRLEEPKIFAIKHRDEQVRMKSRSGGLFTAISDEVLKEHGVIYGAGFKEKFSVYHKRAENKEERDEMRGSKYVQSDLGGIFEDVLMNLQNNRTTLFTGTPCQNAALHRLLDRRNVNISKLYTADIVCHGVPSPMVWKDFLEYMEEKHKGKIESINFRNKELFGWKAHRETVEIGNKVYNSRLYTELYYEHQILRPACYNCKYTNMRRPADITLADFWGVDEILEDFNDNRGVSLGIINTIKGQEIFTKAQQDLVAIDCTGVELPHKNLRRPTKEPLGRDAFWGRYTTRGFKSEAKKVKLRRGIKLIKKKVKSLLSVTQGSK